MADQPAEREDGDNVVGLGDSVYPLEALALAKGSTMALSGWSLDFKDWQDLCL